MTIRTNAMDAIYIFESERLLLEVFYDDVTDGYCFRAEFKGEAVFYHSPFVYRSAEVAWYAGEDWILNRYEEFLDNLPELKQLLGFTKCLIDKD